jgi:hypothetical protein
MEIVAGYGWATRIALGCRRRVGGLEDMRIAMGSRKIGLVISVCDM